MKEKELISHNESDKNRTKIRKTKGFEAYKQEVYESIVRTQQAIKQELKSKQYVELESYTVSKIKKEILETVNRFLPDFKFTEKDCDLKVPPPHIVGNFALETFIPAKKQGLDSNQTAKKIAIAINNAKTNFIKHALAVGPFVNIELNRENLYKKILTEVKILGENYGESSENAGKVVLVDFSSPNIAKPMGVGHLRSTIIGQALYNIYKKTGYSVIRDNHIGDWGTQFGSLIWAYRTWKSDKKIKEDLIRELKNLYVKFHKEAEKNPQIKEEAKQIFADLEKKDVELLALWKKFRNFSLIAFKKIYKRLGINFELYIGESYFLDKCNGLVKECLKNKVCKIDEETGAVVVYSLKGNLSFLVQKNDGSSLYITRDLATLKFRIERFKPETILYVVGQEQKLHFKQLFELAKRLKYLTADTVVKHIDFGMVLLNRKKMSTRKGTLIELENLLDKSVDKSRNFILQKGLAAGIKEIKRVSEIIGIGAILYNDLRRSRISNISFNWNRMLNLEEGSAVYLQYTYARIKSILRKLKNKDKKILERQKIIFQENIEFDLAKKIMMFPEIIIKAQKTDSPHYICIYLEDLAKSFNSFYNDISVIYTSDKDLKRSRILLISAIAQVIKNGLFLLNINVPEKM